jgi:hypothetical protein
VTIRTATAAVKRAAEGRTLSGIGRARTAIKSMPAATIPEPVRIEGVLLVKVRNVVIGFYFTAFLLTGEEQKNEY